MHGALQISLHVSFEVERRVVAFFENAPYWTTILRDKVGMSLLVFYSIAVECFNVSSRSETDFFGLEGEWSLLWRRDCLFGTDVDDHSPLQQVFLVPLADE